MLASRIRLMAWAMFVTYVFGEMTGIPVENRWLFLGGFALFYLAAIVLEDILRMAWRVIKRRY